MRLPPLPSLLPLLLTYLASPFPPSHSFQITEGVYVDLLENPERFTGYAGPSSARVWKAIYEENCFSPIPFIDPSRPLGEEGGSGFPSLSGAGSGGVSKAGGMGGLGGGGLTGGGFGGLSAGGWGESEKKLLGSLAGPRDAGDEQCLEKRVFYRVISGASLSLFPFSLRLCFFSLGRGRLRKILTERTGLHASISVHICDDYLDQTTGEWVRLIRFRFPSSLTAHLPLFCPHPRRLPHHPLLSATYLPTYLPTPTTTTTATRAVTQSPLLHLPHRPAPRTARKHVLHLRPPPPGPLALWTSTHSDDGRDCGVGGGEVWVGGTREQGEGVREDV